MTSGHFKAYEREESGRRAENEEAETRGMQQTKPDRHRMKEINKEKKESLCN